MFVGAGGVVVTALVFNGVTTAGDASGGALAFTRANTTTGRVNVVDIYVEDFVSSISFTNGSWTVYGPIVQNGPFPPIRHFRAVEVYAGAGASCSVSGWASGVWRSLVCRGYSLNHATTPVDSTPTGEASAASSATANAPSATITTPDALALWSESDFDARSVTGPSGFTERSDFANLQTGDRTYPSAGVTGSVSGTLNAASWNTAGLLVLRPQTPGGGSPINLTPGPLPLAIGLPAPSVAMGQDLTPSALSLSLALPAVEVAIGPNITPGPLPVAISLPAPTIAVGGATLLSPVVLRLTLPAVTVEGGASASADAVDMAFYRYVADDGSIWAVKLDKSWGENPASGAEPYVPGSPVLTKRSRNQARKIVVQDFQTGRWTRRVVCTPTAAAWTTPAWSAALPVRGQDGTVQMVKVEHIPERIHRPRAIHHKPAPITQ